MDRSKFIGSSEISAVMGLSRWCSPLKLFALKTGKIEEIEETEIMEWGKRLEEVVAKKFSEKHGVKLMAYKKRFVHPEYEYLSCELDRIITGTETIVEVKTCGAWKAKEFEGEDMPIEFILQVNFALGLSERKTAFIAVLIGGNRYIEKQLKFDLDLYTKQVKLAKEFWEEFVLKNNPPMACADDNDLLAQLYPREVKEKALKIEGEASEMVNQWIGEREGAIAAKKEAENAAKEIEAKIKALLQDHESGETDQYRITWKTQKRPEYTVKESEFRVLRCSAKKGESK